jgi:quinate dehydrogenase
MPSPYTRTRLYIAGGPGGNSIGPEVHKHIAKSLGLNWTCDFLRYPSFDDAMRLFRAPDFAGGIVTMPHKRTVIPLLDSCDELVETLGACNFVYLTQGGQLHGTNTDWVGIQNAILAKTTGHVSGKVAMIYGAGGASRAALYALWAGLKCSVIYLVNRDDQEVEELLEDIHQQGNSYRSKIIHVRTVSQAMDLLSPYYIVSTVPDFEAVTKAEVEARNILVEFLQRKTSQKGLLLDMCYHPPMTRNLQLAKKFGWNIVQGFTVVAHQFAPQWKLWTGKAIGEDEVFELTEKLVHEKEKAATLNGAQIA